MPDNCRRYNVGCSLLQVCSFYYVYNLNWSFGLLYMTQSSFNNSTLLETRNYADRTDLNNIFDPKIESKFPWNEQIQLFLLSADYFGYFPASAVGGWYAEYKKPKRMILIAMGLAMIFNAFVPAFCVWGWVAVLFIRIAIGATHGILIPSIYKLLSNWAPKEELNIFFVIFTGVNFGILMASYFTLSTVKSSNWKWGFFSVSIASALWIGLSFQSLENSPKDHKYISESEKTLILKTTEANLRHRLEAIPYRDIFLSRPFWAAVCLQSTYSCFIFGVVTLVPKFLIDVMHMNLIQLRNEYALQSLIRLVCEPIIMKLTAVFQNKKLLSELNMNKLYVIISHVIPGILIIFITHFPPNRWLLVGLTISMVCTGFWIPSTVRNAFNVTPKYIGLFAGIANAIAGVGFFVMIIILAILANPVSIGINVWKIFCYSIGSVIISAGLFFIGFGSVSRQPYNDFH